MNEEQTNYGPNKKKTIKLNYEQNVKNIQVCFFSI